MYGRPCGMRLHLPRLSCKFQRFGRIVVDAERAHLVMGPLRSCRQVTGEGSPAAGAQSDANRPMGTNKKGQKPKPDQGARGTTPPSTGKGEAPKAGADKEKGGKRKLGLRGAAPWAARHAAKHAAEARARAAEPPLPGSARATIRTPENAEDIKQKVRDLHGALSQIKTLRKNLGKSFYDIGVVLKDIQTRRLYEAKRFPSFESFVEREIDLGKTTAMRLVRVVALFLR